MTDAKIVRKRILRLTLPKKEYAEVISGERKYVAVKMCVKMSYLMEGRIYDEVRIKMGYGTFAPYLACKFDRIAVENVVTGGIKGVKPMYFVYLGDLLYSKVFR